MASSARLLLTGIALVVNTVVIIISAFMFDMVWAALTVATLGFVYTSTPKLDPGMTLIIPAIYFGMLLCMWFALLYSAYMQATRVEDYSYA